MEHLYLLLDEQYNPLAQAMLKSPPGGDTLELWVLDGAVGRLADHRSIQLVGLDDNTPAQSGVIVRTDGDLLFVHTTGFLGSNARENLRVPAEFQSFLYPVSGSWKGRRTIRGKDLSCGGLAFYCAEPLQIGEVAEAVIPVTEVPLVLQVQILRPLPTTAPTPLYAAKFIDMVDEDEFMVRRAVFRIQVRDAR